MTDLAPVLTRIVLRYLSAALITWGIVTPETGGLLEADPDLQQALLILVGGAIAGGTELAYSIARKNGGAT